MVKDRRLAQVLFDMTQLCRTISNVLQALALAGIVGILFFQWESLVAALLTMTAVILAAIASNWSDEWKKSADELSDLLDYSEAFGEPLPVESLRTLLARIPTGIENQAKKRKPVADYFNSQEAPGPRRALELYAESAWWSSELSKRHEQLYGIVTLIVFLALLFLTGIALVVVEDKDAREKLAELVANIVALFITLGFGRLTLQYRAFQRTSENISNAALSLKGKPDVSQIEALTLMHQYQMARSAAPPLHRWIWRRNKDRLNDLWLGIDGRE